MNALAEHWPLDPTILYLNHGSFGACPRAVLDAQSALRSEMEAGPVAFLARRLPDLLDAARARLAAFIGADPENVAFVANATTGVNTVLRSVEIGPGDEILITDHAYLACRNAVEFVATRRDAEVAIAHVPFPLSGEDDVVEAVGAAITRRTRLAVVEHVTSPTGVVFPIERVVRLLADRGVDTLVDGAHAPGMVPLDVERIGAAYYTGNCHKWLCAPKGAAFLWVRPDRRERIRPLVISHGASTPRAGRTRFHDEFDWIGSDDPTAWLGVPAAIDAVAALVPGGWPEVMRRNHDLVVAARDEILRALDVAPPCPAAMLGSLAAVPLPPAPSHSGGAGWEPLQRALYERHRIEVPIIGWPARPRRLVRISAQLYNDPEQYRMLARALVGTLPEWS